MSVVPKPNKTQAVRSLLATDKYSASDIAAMTGVSYSLVTAARRKMRLNDSRDILPGKVSRLQREVRELRRKMAEIEAAVLGAVQK